MTTPLDMIAIGRATIDLNAKDYNQPLTDTTTFAKFVGGSPANIAIGSAKLGRNVGFIGKIADDAFGETIRHYFAQLGVDTTQLQVDHAGHRTGLTFTEIISPTQSDLLMYREAVADLYLTPEEVDADYLRTASSLLISGTGLAASPVREAVLQALAIAKAAGIQVIFELDYRPYTWRKPLDTAIYYQLVAAQADVIIGTRDEYRVLAGGVQRRDEETAAALFAGSAELVVIKAGQSGATAYRRDGELVHSGIYRTRVLKSFGAGDSFAAGFLYAYAHDLGLAQALAYGSAAASIVISQLSSSDAMPTLSALEGFVATHTLEGVGE
ncbi:5-dehydro-2-deoxygluconokinase [Lacticaseibacillus sp. GG6-2]